MNPQVGFLLNTAVGYIHSRNFDTAERFLRQALALDRKNHETLRLLGVIMAMQGHWNDALEFFKKVLKITPNNGVAHSNLGNVYLELNQYEEALSSYNKAIALEPRYAEAYSNRGNALLKLLRHDEAIQAYDLALSLESNHHGFHSNRGNALKELGRYDEALLAYDAALRLAPQDDDALLNKGAVLHAIGLYQEALDLYDRALQINPNSFDAYCNKSITQLLLGDFLGGWSGFRARWKRKVAEVYRHADIPELNSLDGVAGKKVLVWSEQGFGDALQFCRYVPMLVSLGAEVTFELPKALTPLFSGESKYSVITNGMKVEGMDFQAPLLNLPYLFKSSAENVPGLLANLNVAPEKLAFWKEKLVANNGKLNVGIACSGNLNYDKRHGNSRPVPLKLFKELIPNANLHLIQKELREADRESLVEMPEIKSWDSEISDFEDSAAIIGNMDLVISVDTSLAHLAGSLGKKTWVLLPFVPDWRWMLEIPNSPWYPSMRLYRQAHAGDWKAAMETINRDLKALLVQKKN